MRRESADLPMGHMKAMRDSNEEDYKSSTDSFKTDSSAELELHL